MGLYVEDYRTEQGVVIPALYVYLGGIRIIKDLSGTTYTCSFHATAFQSYQDRLVRTNYVPLPDPLKLPQVSLSLESLLETDNFKIAYDTLKERFTSAGYTVRDA